MEIYDYQVPHILSLIDILNKNGRACDLSATGTGKTFSSIAICIEMKLKPFIICPATMQHIWLKIMETNNCNYYGIASYELIKNGYYYKNNIKQECEFIKINGDGYKINNLPNDILFIFDEVHKCKNFNTKNGKILYELAISPAKILLLSATIGDKPIYLTLLLLTLKIIKDIEYAKIWIEKNIKNHKNYMLALFDVLYPKYASRMTLDNIIETSPQNKIIADCYETINIEDIEKEYKNINFCLEQNINSTGIGLIIKARQRIELLKIPIFNELVNYHINNGKSIVIFVNYTETIIQLSKLLNTNCIVYGKQTMKIRKENIEKFNNDTERIIICNIKSGSHGLSFHDLHGNYPRISLISPCWSATDLIQCLGRIYRMDVKTETEQYIIFSNCENERRIQKNIKDKINSIGLLNDGILDDPIFKIDGLIKQYEDTHIDYGMVFEIKKSRQQKLIEKHQQYENDKKRIIQERKEKLPYESMDLMEIIKIIDELETKKSNAKRLCDSKSKIELLKNIEFEINKHNEYIKNTF